MPIPTDMRQKAANRGDRLKHALLLESLKAIVESGTWRTLTYAETHAGAGKYLAADQEKPRQIEPLQRKVRRLERKAAQGIVTVGPEAAGATYLSLVKRWWQQEENWSGGRPMHPGSVAIAKKFLEERWASDRFSWRLTEASESTWKALQRTIREALNASFLDKLDWLTEQDHLLLLVDPFVFKATMPLCEGCAKRIKSVSGSSFVSVADCGVHHGEMSFG